MDVTKWIGMLPLWAVFSLTWALCIASVELGSALAVAALRRKKEKEPDGPMGSLVAALMGLLAFILAFTFGMTASRFETRRQLVLQESNSISTTYLYADLLPQKQRLEIRRLLREYTDIRVNVTAANLQESLNQSEDLHDRLWSQAKSLVPVDMDSQLRSLYLSALNELMDLHQSRKTVALQYMIPGTVWVALYLLSGMSMLTVGYQVGMSGMRHMRGTPVLAAAFSLVILMIADMERPTHGLMRVSQQPIADVQQMMLHNSP